MNDIYCSEEEYAEIKRAVSEQIAASVEAALERSHKQGEWQTRKAVREALAKEIG